MSLSRARASADLLDCTDHFNHATGVHHCAYGHAGNAAQRFNQLDTHVWTRLRALRIKRKGRNLRAGEVDRRTRELRTHGLEGSLARMPVVRPEGK